MLESTILVCAEPTGTVYTMVESEASNASTGPSCDGAEHLDRGVHHDEARLNSPAEEVRCYLRGAASGGTTTRLASPNGSDRILAALEVFEKTSELSIADAEAMAEAERLRQLALGKRDLCVYGTSFINLTFIPQSAAPFLSKVRRRATRWSGCCRSRVSATADSDGDGEPHGFLSARTRRFPGFSTTPAIHNSLVRHSPSGPAAEVMVASGCRTISCWRNQRENKELHAPGKVERNGLG